MGSKLWDCSIHCRAPSPTKSPVWVDATRGTRNRMATIEPQALHLRQTQLCITLLYHVDCFFSSWFPQTRWFAWMNSKVLYVLKNWLSEAAWYREKGCKLGFWCQAARLWILTPSLTSWLSLDKFLNVSEFAPHVINGARVVVRTKLNHAQYLAHCKHLVNINHDPHHVISFGADHALFERQGGPCLTFSWWVEKAEK